MELNLNNKVVIITGGSKGIGLAAAKSFAHEGCKTAICGRNIYDLEVAAGQIKNISPDVYFETLDVTDSPSLQNFAENVSKIWGSIDIWINNAGMPIHKPMMETSDAEWNQMVATNLTAVYQGCKVAASHMKKNGGIIFNAGSFQTLFPAAGSGPYGATKAAIASLTRTFAAELAPYKIRVLTYIPGVIETPMANVDNWAQKTHQLDNIPVRRLGTPEDIANTLVFLASDKASYINGVSIEITGGKFCVQNPGYSWKL